MPHSGFEFADPSHSFVDDIEPSRNATTKARKDVEWQRALVSAAKKQDSDAFNDVTNQKKVVAVSDRHEAEWFSNVSPSSSCVASATA